MSLLDKKVNKIISKKRKIRVVAFALVVITLILFMDISRIFVSSEPNDEYVFFYDDFTYTTTNSTELWKGTHHIEFGKLTVVEQQTCWADVDITGWSGYSKLKLRADIMPDTSSLTARILIKDAYSNELLYAIHPSQVSEDIDISSYVDLTSTNIKIEIHGYVKFDVIKLYTPTLFVHNLLLDDNAEDFGITIPENSVSEEGSNPAFSGYSKYFDFDPGVSAAATLETKEYFIPYLKELNLLGLFSRSYYEDEECVNDTLEIKFQVKERYGWSHEITTLHTIYETINSQASSVNIPLAQYTGKDISFIIKIKVLTSRPTPTYFPDLFISFLGVSAKASSKINSRDIEAVDFATKDMFTQITPAMVGGEEKLVLARDRPGDIATYRSYVGTESQSLLFSGYDLTEYLYNPASHDEWQPGSGGNGLVAKVNLQKESVIALNSDQPKFSSSGVLEAYFNLNAYGVAAGIAFKYSSSSEYWVIAVQRNRETEDLALLIHNGDIIDTMPLMRKLGSDINIKIERVSYLDYYQFVINEQYTFKKAPMTAGTTLGFYYRVVEAAHSYYYEPVVFQSMTIYSIAEYDVTRMYVRAQNPTTKTAKLYLKEVYGTYNNHMGERLIATIEVPATIGFETIIADCLCPAYNSRFIIESDDETLLYLSNFGFLGYTPFGQTLPASLYYDIDQEIINDHRVRESELIIEDSYEWVSYDMELKEFNLFYIHANATKGDNLELSVEIREINSTGAFTPVGEIYFIEKDGYGYSHHFYLNLTKEGFNEGIFQVKVKVTSTIDEDNPCILWHLGAKEIPDKLMGADYSSIDQSIEGWREEWDIDTRDYDYLNQLEWYSNVAFSALNGGPTDNWVMISDYATTVLSNPWDWNKDDDQEGWTGGSSDIISVANGTITNVASDTFQSIISPTLSVTNYDDYDTISFHIWSSRNLTGCWVKRLSDHTPITAFYNFSEGFQTITLSLDNDWDGTTFYIGGNIGSIETTVKYDWVKLTGDNQLEKEENAFYTSLTLSSGITERFLGYNIDAVDYPFIEMKIRSQNTTICNEMKFGIHSLPYGVNTATVSLNDYWTWYRFNLNQLAYQNYKIDYPDNIPTTLLFDKVFLNFSGAIDISAIKVYSIADWEYVPTDTDTVFTTAHLEGSQETILRIDSNTTLSYNASIDSSLWEETIFGRWEYNLDFVLEDTNTKTTILSLYNATEEYVFDLYIQNNKLYFDDTEVSFEDSSFAFEPYRWYKLSCYAYQNDTLNWVLMLSIADTTAEREFTTNISEDSNITHMKLSIETTNSVMYLRNIGLVLNDTVDKGQSFVEETEFVYSIDTDDADIWTVDSTGECYLTKLYRGFGGTIASSAMYLVLDEGITLRRTNLNVEFLAPEDFYIYLKAECYGQDVHLYINEDQDIEEDGLHEDTTYELDKYVFGSVIDRISFTAVNGCGYIRKLRIWGNYSWGDYYSDFGDGEPALRDWSFDPNTLPITVSKDGDLVITNWTNSTIASRAAYYNGYFIDYVTYTSINCSSYGDISGEREIHPEIWEYKKLGNQIKASLVLQAQSKSYYKVGSGLSAYVLTYQYKDYDPGEGTDSAGIYLYYHKSGSAGVLIDSYSAPQLIFDDETPLTFGASIFTHSSFVEIEVFCNNTVVGRTNITSTDQLYPGGYTGVGLHIDHFQGHLTEPFRDTIGCVTEFSVLHKYYYPTSDNVVYNTANKDNYFAGGRLFVDYGEIEITDLGDNDYQKTIVTTFELQFSDIHIFIGSRYESSSTYYFGFEFENGKIYIHNGSTSLAGGTLVHENWITTNIGRELYFIMTIYENPLQANDWYIEVQLFSEKEFRPKEGEVLNYRLYSDYNPEFDIVPVTPTKGDLIIEAIELGGSYPVDKEWLDGSVSHGIRGGGEIADYYLQAVGQGAMKILSPSDSWMTRQFYVPESTNSTKLSFTYLSTGLHIQTYIISIYKGQDTDVYVYIESDSNNGTYEKITVATRNGVNIVNQTVTYVPYYQWITVEVLFATSLELKSTVSYNREIITKTGVIYSYPTANQYYYAKVTKPADSGSDKHNFYLSAIALQNGGGFSSTFGTGDFSGWDFSNSNRFEYSTEVTLNPDSLILYCEPLGGWCDITISVDNGAYERETQIEVEDYETFRPYILRLPEDLDATEIHKYTIIADGILTIYSVGFEQSLTINEWLIAKPFVNDKIKDESTAIGDVVIDFTDPYQEDGTTDTPDPAGLFGDVGNCTSSTNYGGNDLSVDPNTWTGSIGFWFRWNGDGAGVSFIRFELYVNAEYEDEPFGEYMRVYIYIQESVNGKEGLHFRDSTYTPLVWPQNAYFDLYLTPDAWNYLFFDLDMMAAYICDATKNDGVGSIFGLEGFKELGFGPSGTPKAVFFIDDITTYDNDVEMPGPFARALTTATGINSDSVWDAQQVNSIGFLDFGSILDIDGYSTEQASFVMQCNKETDAKIHISTTHPFTLYQGRTIIYSGLPLSLDKSEDYYINVHLYDGVNRFTIRSHGKYQINDNNWLLKADILAPSHLEIISAGYQAKNSTSQENWYIDQWLVSDRPIPVEECSYLYRDGWGMEPPIDEVEEDLQNLGFYDPSVMMPFAGEQLNFTVPTEYGVNVTEWVGFVNNIPDEYGYTNYLNEGVNTTDVEDGDQIIYYTNIHFLQNITDGQLKIKHYGEIEAIYWDSQYVYGDLGGMRHYPYASAVSTIQGVNDSETITIDLWDWYEFRFWKEAGHSQWASIYPDFEPATAGLHKLMVVVNGDNNGTTVHLDISGSLTKVDDTVNVLTGVTEYIVSKQAQQEKAPTVQLDDPATPNSGNMGPNSKWAGKKIVECTFRYDGIRYHSSRTIYMGVEDWGQYEDLNGDTVIDAEDAMGMLTTMVVEDAGTKHESTAVVQQAIGMNADNYSESQPTQLCIPYTMVGQNILNGLLFSTTNTRLSYSSYNSSLNDFELTLEFNQNDLASTRFFIDNSTYKTQVLGLFNNFISTTETITMRFSLNGPVVLETGNETLIIDLDRVYMIVEEFGINFDKNLQRLNIAYVDKRNLEEITIQLKSRFMMHLDPLGVHMSYKKIGSRNIGFIVYDIDKIIAIANGKIAVPSQIKLGLFSGISSFFKRVKDSFATVVDAIQESMKAVNARMHEFLQKIGGAIHEAIYKVVDGIMVLVGYIVDGIKVLVDKIVTVVKGIVEIIKNIAIRVGQGIANLFEKIFETAIKAWKYLKKVVNNVLEKCKAFIKKAIQWLKKIFDIIGDGFRNLFKKIARIFVKAQNGEDYGDEGTSDSEDSSVKQYMNSVRFDGLTASEKAKKAFLCLYMANPLMDCFRLMLLSQLALIFGTNVGMYKTDEVVTSVYQNKVFDNDTVKEFNHVYQLDHVIDFLAGRQDKSGHSTFDPWDSSTWSEYNIKPGMGENTTIEDVESEGFWDRFCAIFFAGDPLSRWNWITCKMDDGDDPDWYFGLRTRIQFGYGPYAIKIPFISEKLYITISEVIAGFLPGTGLIQDIKDSCLEPSPIFRRLAGAMIPFDILECFGEPNSIFMNKASDGFKFGVKGIKQILCSFFEIIRRLANGIKSVVFHALGGTIAKVLVSVGFVALVALGVLISCLMPATFWPIFGMTVAIGLIIGLVLFFCDYGRRLAKKQGVDGPIQRWQYDEANRMENIIMKSDEEMQEWADEVKKLTKKQTKDMKKNWKEKIGDFFRERIRRLKEVYSKSDEIGFTHCIDPQVRYVCGITLEQLITTKLRHALDSADESHFYEVMDIFWGGMTYEELSLEAKRIADYIAFELYDTFPPTTFFANPSSDEISDFFLDTRKLYGFYTSRRGLGSRGSYERFILGSKLQRMMEKQISQGNNELLDILKKHFPNKPELHDWRRLYTYDFYDDNYNYLLKFYQELSKDALDIIQRNLKETFKDRFVSLKDYLDTLDTNYKLILGDIDDKLLEDYSLNWIERADPKHSSSRGKSIAEEDYMQIWRKLHFDVNTDPRAILYDQIKLIDTNLVFVKGEEAIGELIGNKATYKDIRGIDDAFVIHWVQDGKPKHICIVDSLKGTTNYGYGAIKGNILDLTKRAGIEDAIEERRVFLLQMYSREWQILKNRPDIAMLNDELIEARILSSLDSLSTDGILKMYDEGSNLLFGTQFKAIKESDFYKGLAIDIDDPPIFVKKYSSWSDMLQDQANLDKNLKNWNDFVHQKTEEVMMTYVRELQMQELALTGRATIVDGFDKDGHLKIRRINGKIQTTDSISIKFLDSNGIPYERTFDIKHSFLHPELKFDGKLGFKQLPSEFYQPEFAWLKTQIEDIQKRIIKELELEHIDFRIVSKDILIDTKEKLQRQASALFQRYLVEEGLIDGFSSGMESSMRVNAIIMSSNYHPASINAIMEERMWYHSSRSYDSIMYIEDDIGSGYSYKHSYDKGYGTKQLKRQKKAMKLQDLPKKTASKYCTDPKLTSDALKDYMRNEFSLLEDLNKEYVKYIGKPTEFPGGENLYHIWKTDIELALAISLNDIKSLDNILQLGVKMNLKNYDRLTNRIIRVKNRFFDGSFAGQVSILNSIKKTVTVEETYNHRIFSIVTFLDEFGNKIRINDEPVGIVMDWAELLNRPDNPLKKYTQFSDYLLIQPFKTEYYSSNPIINWEETDENSVSYENVNNDFAENEYQNFASQWKLDNIQIKTTITNEIYPFGFQKAWTDYLKINDYSDSIINLINNPKAINILDIPSEQTSRILAINAIGYEYNNILYQFKNWIIDLLDNQDQMFKKWEEYNLSLNEIWSKFKFKENGVVKAKHDNSRLTYEGLRLKNVVYLSFVDYVKFEYENGTTDWSYLTLPWTINGFSSKIESKMGIITQQGLQYLLGPEADPKKTHKLYSWLIGNVFSICGLM